MLTDEQRREYYRRYYQKHRDIILARNKEWQIRNKEQFSETVKYSKRKKYIHLKAAGICVNCGKEPAREGRITCLACQQKNTEYQRKLREKKRRERNGTDS